MGTWAYIWKTSLITGVSVLPIFLVKFLHRKYAPGTHAKIGDTEN